MAGDHGPYPSETRSGRVVGTSVVSTRGRTQHSRGVPVLAQHTDELLTEAGLADRIADLRAAGVVA